MRILRPVLLVTLALSLTACDKIAERFKRAPKERPAAAAGPGGEPPPPAGARTADEYDTTTDEQRQAALAPTEKPDEKKLGLTIASLGDPASPGFWLETPLVTEVTQGRVVNPATGASVQVELRPSGGEKGSGSRISLSAMRLLGASLTDLPEIEVYAP